MLLLRGFPSNSPLFRSFFFLSPFRCMVALFILKRQTHMARRKRTANCARCGRCIKLCRYNAYHQKYCTDVSCVTERRRERRRNSYRKRYRDDAHFREAEQTRCRRNIRRRRIRCATAKDPSDTSLTPLNFEFFVTGLLAQIIGSNDPGEVHDAAYSLQQRGQRLAIATPTTRGSPQ